MGLTNLYQASFILHHCLWLSLLPTTPNKRFVAQKEGQSRELGIMSSFRRSRSKLLRTGADRSVLEGGIARLSRLEARQLAQIDQLSSQDNALARLQALVNDAISEGRRLGAKHHSDLERLVAEQAEGFRDEVLAEGDPKTLKLKAERLAQWWNDEALQVELLHWAKRAAEELNDWRERSSETIGRRLESPEFKSAFGKHSEAAPDTPDDKEGRSWFASTFNKVGRAMNSATRDIVYKIGKAFKFKFKPWGAVKIAAKLAKVGAVMSIAGVVWDIADIFLDEQRHAQREEARKELAKFLRDRFTI
jgi:hypothetical protein